MNLATDNDMFYHQRRKEFADVVDRWVAQMKKDNQEEAQMRTHIGIYDINCLTSTVHLVDRPAEEDIDKLPKHERDTYNLFRKIAKEVWEEKGFNLLEY